ncbi:MAG: NRAMP family divalent metal transporter [Chitinophagales bacterium]
MSKQKSFADIIQLLGPGLLFAGAAVGVSHLVQSTKAGAIYGFGLLLAVIIANIVKYPFFEFGTRYAMATGENLVRGYKRQGNWAFILFIFMTVGTMFTIQAAVTIVTASLAVSLIGGFGIMAWCAILLLTCMTLLLLGRYAILDNLMKVIIIILSLSTFFALISVLFLGTGVEKTSDLKIFTWDTAGITFLIALMGWMPAPIDLSVWSSIWTLEKKKLNEDVNFNTSLLDFNVGYIGTSILAICFLSLGALVMYGTGEVPSEKGAVFAQQLIDLYTTALGSWSKPIIAVAALTTMFSTTLTCLDAFPRVLSEITFVLKPEYETTAKKQTYIFWIILVIAGALLLLNVLQAQMGLMIKIATILSFLTAPFLAFINYKLVTGEHIPEAAKPPKWLKYLSWIGLAFLILFSLLFLYSQFAM